MTDNLLLNIGPLLTEMLHVFTAHVKIQTIKVISTPEYKNKIKHRVNNYTAHQMEGYFNQEIKIINDDRNLSQNKVFYGHSYSFILFNHTFQHKSPKNISSRDAHLFSPIIRMRMFENINNTTFSFTIFKSIFLFSIIMLVITNGE